MGISSYPNGFPSGLTIRGLPVDVVHPGKVFFLNNTAVLPPGGIAGSDNNPGTLRKPFKTLVGAMSMCVASRGDVIMVAPGHAETISSSIAMTLATAGVLIVGTGVGALRPTFTLNTATSATINITAAGISFVNCLFLANFAAIVSCFTLTTAKNLSLVNCEFRDLSSSLNFITIVTTDTTSDDADGLLIDNCNIFGLGTSTNTAMVSMLGTNDRIQISNCYQQNKSVGAVAGVMPIAAGKIVTNFIMKNNIFNLTNVTTDTVGILITTNGSTNTGVLMGNMVKGLDDTSVILVTASSGFIYYNNYYAGTADVSGFLLPAVGT